MQDYDREEIVDLIGRCSKNTFDKIIKIILKDVYSLSMINIDGCYDGGSDFWSYGNDTKVKYGIQVTIREQGWEEKALENARTARRKLGINRYYFFHKFSHGRATLDKLEELINENVGVMTKCFGAREIAALIVEGDIISSVMAEIDPNYSAPKPDSPDKLEAMLYSFMTFSRDARNLKEAVITDAFLLSLYFAPSKKLSKQTLLDEVAKMLDGDSSLFEKHIDRLMTNNFICYNNTDSSFSILPASYDRLDLSFKFYAVDKHHLINELTAVFQDYNIEIINEEINSLLLTLAYLAIDYQLENIRKYCQDLKSSSLFKNVRKEKLSFERFLTEKIDDEAVQIKVKEEIINIICVSPVIIRMMKSAIFLALDDETPLNRLRSIGVNSWQESYMIIDSSVAMPYLCGSIFDYTYGRFSKNSIGALKILSKEKCNLYIPYEYLDECTFHLMTAFDRYDDKIIALFDDVLIHSENAYVEAYVKLKNQGIEIPDGFISFLKKFSNSIVLPNQEGKKKKVSYDLQMKLMDYNVNFLDDFINIKISVNDLNILQKEYSYYIYDSRKNDSRILMEHDVYVIYKILESQKNGKKIIMLTFDKTMIEFSQKQSQTDEYFPLVLPPETLADFVLSVGKKKRNKEAMIGLADRLATVESISDIGCQFIEKLISIIDKNKMNHQRADEIAKHKNELLKDIKDKNIKPDITLNQLISEKAIEAAKINNLLPDIPVTLGTAE